MQAVTNLGQPTVGGDIPVVGLQSMDSIHDEFISLVERVRIADDSMLLHGLAELQSHCQEHFRHEEQLMRESDFPALNCHAAEHNAVLSSVSQVYDVVVSGGDLRLVRRLLEELLDWFYAHVAYLDAPIAQWIVKRRTGGVPLLFRNVQNLAAT